MTKNKSLEALLDFIENYGASSSNGILTSDEYNNLRTEAKEEILQSLLGLIGEDEGYNEMCEHCSDWDDGRNDLRAELRIKFREWVNK